MRIDPLPPTRIPNSALLESRKARMRIRVAQEIIRTLSREPEIPRTGDRRNIQVTINGLQQQIERLTRRIANLSRFI
jgi:hypothetical protein